MFKKEFEKYLYVLINSCKSTIEQMTRMRVNDSQARSVSRDQGKLPFAHIVNYVDDGNGTRGEVILGFQSTSDALKLASELSDRLGLGRFEKIGEDSIDLLNEFLNIAVGRTISEWDRMGPGIRYKFPLFKKNYQSTGPRNVKGYIITLNTTSKGVLPEDSSPMEDLLLRVSLVEKIENKIENKKILIAEDSKVMRTIIAKALKEVGAKIIEAKDGEEAVRLHKLHQPDLAIVDINMPKMSGLDAIAGIRKFHPSAKCMILSSSSRKDEIISAKTLKVSGYLVKPVDQDKLIERVSAVI